MRNIQYYGSKFPQSITEVDGVVDVSGSTVDCNGSLVDASGSTVDCNGSLVDASGSTIAYEPGTVSLIFDNVSIDINAVSDEIDKGAFSGCSFDLVCTETAALVGVIQVQVCNDLTMANWQPVTLAGGVTDLAVAGTSEFAIDLDVIRFKYIRVAYISTGGTGTIRGFVHLGPN